MQRRMRKKKGRVRIPIMANPRPRMRFIQQDLLTTVIACLFGVRWVLGLTSMSGGQGSTPAILATPCGGTCRRRLLGPSEKGAPLTKKIPRHIQSIGGTQKGSPPEAGVGFPRED